MPNPELTYIVNMNRYKIKSIVFSALWGMAILNSVASSCSKKKEPTEEENKKEMVEGIKAGLKSQMPQKDIDTIGKVLLGEMTVDESGIPDHLKIILLKLKKEMDRQLLELKQARS